MTLFSIQNGKAIRIKKKPLENEKELHSLIESNLEEILGVKLIEKEYPIPNGRIDTLGVDESGIPVIIEYKWKQTPGAIDQGLFYLDWLVNNKRTFDMLAREKLGRDFIVEWSIQPRLIIISEAFDTKEIAAIRQIKPTVELYKYAMYGDMFWLEDVSITSRPVVAPKYIKPSHIIPGKEEVEIEGGESTIEGFLNRINASEEIKKAFYKIRDEILKLGDDVEERTPLKSMVPYYSDGRGLVWLAPTKTLFRFYLRKGQYNDPHQIVTKERSWGNYPEARIREIQEEIDNVVDLIKQGYKMLK